MNRGGLIQHGANGHTTLVPVFATGQYTGDGSADRTIAHGLGQVPKYIIIIATHASAASVLYTVLNTVMTAENAAKFTVTGWDATNFHVGKAATFAGNEVGYTYDLIAFG